MANLGRSLGRLFYKVDVDTGPLSRGLAKGSAEVKAAAAAMDKLDAEIKIKGDISQFERKAAQVKEIVTKMERDKINLETRIDSASSKKELKELNQEMDVLNRNLKEEKQNHKELRSILSYKKTEVRDTMNQRRALEQQAKAQGKVTEETRKNALQVVKLQQAYRQAAKDLDKHTKSMQVGKQQSRDWQLETQRLTETLRDLDHQVTRAGGSTRDLDKDLNESRHRFRQWGSGLGEVRVHLGFFSASLKQVSVGLLAVGPLLWSLVGAASALVGVLGTASVGALSVGTAAMLGFGQAALGVGLVIKPLVHSLGVAIKASRSYGDAVLKYGKGSEQAKDKLAQLNHTLKGVSPEARKAIANFGLMRNQWQKLTAPSRAKFFEMAGEGIKTMNTLMPAFAKNTNETFSALNQGWGAWMKGLRGGEAQRILDNTFDNANKSIPSLMDGLGSLATMLGRIGEAASKFLPELSGGFAKWAKSLADGVGPGTDLDSRMGRLIDHMQSFGHFAQASGRMLVTFFNAGADSGKGLLDSMTTTFNRWNDWMKSAHGRNELAGWFKETTDTARQLIPALVRIGSMFFAMSEVLAPALKLATTGLNALAQGINALPGPLKTVIGLLILAGMWAKSLLATVAGAALFSRLSGGGALVGGAGGVMGKLFGSGGAAKAGQELTLFSTASGGAAMGLLKFAGAAGLTAVGLKILYDSFLKTEDSQHKFAEASAKLFPAASRSAKAVRELTAANQGLAGAQKRYNAAVKEGGITTKKSQMSALDLLNARNRQQAAQREQNEAIEEQTDLLDEQRDAYEDMRDTLEHQKDLDHPWQADKLSEDSRELAHFRQQMQLTAVNVARAKAGLDPLAASMGRLMTQLRKAAGKKAQFAVGLVGNQRVAKELASTAVQAKRLGATPARIRTILEGDAPAKVKMQQLWNLVQRLRAQRARVKVDADTNSARAKIAAAFADLRKYAAQHPKAILKTDNSQAMFAIATATGAALDFAGTYTANLIANYSGGNIAKGRDFTRYSGGPVGFAGGGPTSAQMEQANVRASRQAAMGTSRGAEVRKPTYITGEENRKEYVIATNPAYRMSNLGYLAAAAAELGMGLIPGFALGGSVGNSKPSNIKPFKRGRMSQYDYLHRLINWSDTDFGLDQSALDSDVARKLIPKDKTHYYDPLTNDIDRSVQWYKELQALLAKQMKHTNKKLKRDSRIARSAKKEAAGIDGTGKEAKNKRDHLRNKAQRFKGKAKNEKQRLQGLQAEYNFDNPQAMRALLLQKQGLMDERDGFTDTGGSEPDSPGAQAFGANQAMRDMFKSFSSNIISVGGAQAGGQGMFGPSVGSSSYNPLGTTSQLPPGFGSGGFPSNPGVMSPGGVEVHNYFSAPPPDPHTWTQQQQFELEAL